MWTYRPQLDGLRSVAVYLVLVFHCGVAALAGGFIGVDVFFVLSGFLVTNVMLEEIRRTGTLSLGGFYARRVRRLLPAAVLVVVATCLLFVLVASVTRRLEIVGDARAALLYVANWHFLGQSNDYFAQEDAASPFLHFWSLAIEEQFYVVFPVVLLLLARRARRRLRTTALVVGALGLASLGAQLFWMSADPNHAYYGTDARLYQLLAGALLAVVLVARPRLEGSRWGSAPVSGAGAVLGLVALGVLGSGLVDVVPGWRGMGASVATVVVIGAITLRSRSWVARGLARPVPVYLGKISYGTYLWHWPVVLVLLQIFDARPLVIFALTAAIATGIASLSFHVLETPLRTNAWLSRKNLVTVGAGVGVSALVAFTLVPQALESDRLPVQLAGASAPGQGTAANDDRPVPRGIDFAAYADDRGPDDTFCTLADQTSCVVHEGGSGLDVVLAGDSHARMMAPVLEDLAEEHDFTLSLSVIGACSWQQGVRNTLQVESQQELCTTTRDDLYDDLVEDMGIDVVVLAQSPRDGGSWEENLQPVSGESDDIDRLNRTTIEATLASITDSGAQAVVLESMLRVPTDLPNPLVCLSGARTTGECRVPVPLEGSKADSFVDAVAAFEPDVTTIGINALMCPAAPLCEPLDGRVPVWRDGNHYAPAAIQLHADQIWDLLVGTGAFGD